MGWMRLCAGLSLVAWASASDAQNILASDIVVTAQKREQAPGDIGIALSVTGSAELALFGHQDIATLAEAIPALRVQSYSPTITIFNIRGVSQNDYSDAQEAPIAFYEDEIYVSAPGAIAGRTYDLERVETLRGPQGTLFGRNATGGLVQIITAKPTATRTAYATVTAGSFGQIATEGAISGPLSDRIRARLAFSTDYHDGYIHNRSGADVGNSRFWAGRLQVAADVGDTGVLLLKVQGLREDDRAAGQYAHDSAAPDALGLGRFLGPGETDALGYAEPDSDPFTAGFNDPVRLNRKLTEASARYDGALGSAKLTAIVDYQHLTKDYAEDSDMSPATFLTSTNTQDLDQWSGEFRLSGETKAVRWLAGVNGVHIKSRNGYVIDASNSAGLLEEYGGTLTTESAALFGQLEYVMAPRWTVIVGARFTHDHKSYDFVHQENGMVDLRFNEATLPGLAARDFDDWSGKLQFDYRPVGGLLLYASVDRGTKSGGYSAPAVLPTDIREIGFEPEVLTSYSAGAKAKLANGQVQVALTGFHYDYDDYQAFENSDGFTLSVHNKYAMIDGVELEAEARPLGGLTLKGSGALLHGTVRNVVLPLPQPSGTIRDRQMPNAPHFSATGFLDYRWPMLKGTTAFSTSWRYESSQYLTPFNAEVDRVSPHIVGDMRLAWRSGSAPVEIAAFVNNVTDTRYRLFDIDFSLNFGFVQSAYARPRWAGFSVTLGR